MDSDTDLAMTLIWHDSRVRNSNGRNAGRNVEDSEARSHLSKLATHKFLMAIPFRPS